MSRQEYVIQVGGKVGVTKSRVMRLGAGTLGTALLWTLAAWGQEPGNWPSPHSPSSPSLYRPSVLAPSSSADQGFRLPAPDDSPSTPTPSGYIEGYAADACEYYPSCTWGARGASWYGDLRYLYMTRDDSENVWLSYDTDNLPHQLLNTRDADWNWTSGFQATVGRSIGCGPSAWELRYWGLGSATSEANAYGDQVSGNFDTIVDFTPLVYDNGLCPHPVSTYFVDAERHRVLRSHELQSVEWNLVRQAAATCPTDWDCHPWRLQWEAGLRYVRFDEGLEYATDGLNRTFGDQPESELFYDIDVQNHLVGTQIGGRFDYCFSPRVNFHTTSRVGLFYNHVRHKQFLGGANGAAFIDEPGGPFDGELFAFTSTKDDVAIVAELETGISYQLNAHWSLQLGYRVFALSGVAVASEQVPFFFEDLVTASHVDSASSVLYHGGFAGIEFLY